MSVSALSEAAVALLAAPLLASTSPSGLSVSSTSAATATVPSASAVTVSMSQAAQQALASPSAAEPVTPSLSATDPNAQAIAVLYDTSGKVSVADQVQAYGQLVGFVQGQPGGGADYTQAKSGAVVALIDSPFAQHAQSLLNQVSAAGATDSQNGDGLANAIDSGLAAFNGLSARDQQIFVGINGLASQTENGIAPISSVEDYRANQQALAGVDRALQVAISSPTNAAAIATAREKDIASGRGFYSQGFNNDAYYLAGIATANGDTATADLANLYLSSNDTVNWTRQAQAYFAANGPAPPVDATTSAAPSNAAPVTPSTDDTTSYGQAVAAALAAVWNTTGNASITDQTAGLQTLRSYYANSQDSGPAKGAIASLSGGSPFEKQAYAAADDFLSNPAVMTAFSGNVAEAPSQTVVGLLDNLPLAQQQLIFAGAGLSQAASLDDYKTLLNQEEAANAAMAGAGSPSTTDQQSTTQATPSNANATTRDSTIASSLNALLPPKTTWTYADVALHLLLSDAQADRAAKPAENLATIRVPAASSTTQTRETNQTANPASTIINLML